MKSDGTGFKSSFGRFRCQVFWTIQLALPRRFISRFLDGYLTAWRHQLGNRYEVVIFADGNDDSVLLVPCPAPGDGIDDEHLFSHLFHMHQINRMRRGMLGMIIPKSLVKVEVIEVGPKETNVETTAWLTR